MLDWISLENFRNIPAARIDAASASVGIIGRNGSGKTSILEAIYFLGHGRSFRSAQRTGLISRGARMSRVLGSFAPEGVRVGVEFSSSHLELRMGGESCTVSQIASQVPIQLVDPSVHLIVEEGSARRRRLFDWGVFHVEPRFGQEWRVYQRALRQRNAALRAQMWSVDHALREELQESGERLHIMRETYFRKLVPVFDVVLRELLDDDIEIRYRRGWPDDLTLTDALSAVYDRDRRIRTTTVGPHRADLELTMASGLAREVVSRGQQKLLASALVLAQTRLLTSELARSAVLLIDDPAAELDVDNLGKLLRAVAKTPAQVVATSLVGSSLDALDIGRMFHVKQGQVTPML